MKFLLELVACCGSSSGTPMVKEETRLLAGSVPSPSPSPGVGLNMRRKRVRPGPNGGGSGSGALEWRPSLSSICEDNAMSERAKNEQQPPRKVEEAVVRSSSSSSSSSSKPSSDRNLKRKTTSTSRSRSYSSGEDARRPTIHAVMPTFSPAPFMF